MTKQSPGSDRPAAEVVERYGLIEIPFPLDRGYMGSLILPGDGLTTRDVERLHEVIDSLRTDPQTAKEVKDGR